MASGTEGMTGADLGLSPDNIFAGAPVLSAYSRAQAINDGFLVNVSAAKAAVESGFKVPVCLTRALHEKLTPPKKSTQSYDARLWDVFFLFKFVMRSAKGASVMYKVKVGRENLIVKAVLDGDGFTFGLRSDF